MDILDAAVRVLGDAKRPMSAEELAEKLVGEGLWKSESSIPAESVSAALYSDVKKFGVMSRFANVGNGYFALSSDIRKEDNDVGFVYILTHRNFKDGIVKIGQTRGDVEKRNKALFSTELPWPFDVYATMKTSRFVETEKLIHYFLAEKRINPKREFFAITPEKALEIFRHVQDVLPDCIIYDDYRRETVYEDDEPQSPEDGSLTDGQKLSLDFWAAFNEYVKGRPDVVKEFSLHKPNKYGFHDLRIGHATYHITMRVTSRKGIVVAGLYFSGDKKSYDLFLANHEEVEKCIGESVEWVWAKKDGVIQVVKDFDASGSRSEWPVAFGWLCDTVLKLKCIDEKFGEKR